MSASPAPGPAVSQRSRWSSFRQRAGDLGIRGKLFLAFGTVAAATVAASIVALLSYLAIQTRLTAITGTDVPAMTQTQHLAVQTATLAAATLDLDTVTTQDERAKQLDRLNGMANALLQQVDTVEALVGKNDKVDDLRSLALSVVGDIGSQNEAVVVRLDTHGQRVAAASELGLLHVKFLRAVAPQIARASESQHSSANGPADDKAGFVRLRAFLELAAAVNLMAGAVAEAADTDAPDRIEVLRALRGDMATVTAALRSLPDEITSDPAVAIARGFARFSQGPTDVFSLRQQELGAASGSLGMRRPLAPAPWGSSPSGSAPSPISSARSPAPSPICRRVCRGSSTRSRTRARATDRWRLPCISSSSSRPGWRRSAGWRWRSAVPDGPSRPPAPPVSLACCLVGSVRNGRKIERSARVRTLLPLLRHVFLVLLVALVSLIVLSELGIDITPLLAGAGVIGLAIGFGSQTLVKDVITGLFILFEDTISVGDVVDVGGHSGLVEALSIRTIRLRDASGGVHTVPFSAVSTVHNMTKDYAYYVFDVGVTYREDVDRVIAVLHELGATLQADPAYRTVILAPLEVMGVDAFRSSAVIIKARFKTVPIQQWSVGREFNRRMKIRFDELGIEMPLPHLRLTFGADRQGDAPPVHVRVGAAEAIEALGEAMRAHDGRDAASAAER